MVHFGMVLDIPTISPGFFLEYGYVCVYNIYIICVCVYVYVYVNEILKLS